MTTPGTIETHMYRGTGSFSVQITRFVLDNQWYWREQWLKCKPSDWNGPHATREAAEQSAGVTRADAT